MLLLQNLLIHFMFMHVIDDVLLPLSKWVTNAGNWNFSRLVTSKSIHLQYSQRLKKSDSAQII